MINQIRFNYIRMSMFQNSGKIHALFFKDFILNDFVIKIMMPIFYFFIFIILLLFHSFFISFKFS